MSTFLLEVSKFDMPQAYPVKMTRDARTKFFLSKISWVPALLLVGEMKYILCDFPGRTNSCI